MRITHSMLMKNLSTFVAEQARKDHGLICVYLAGSMLTEDALIGGAGDIDLIFIHTYPVQPERELFRLTNEIHYDVRHLPQQMFEDPKHLRHDAWLGSSVWQKPLVLHEKNHWFDFVLAGVYAQFTRPENVIRRVRPFLDQARAEWMALSLNGDANHPVFIARYLQAVENAANAAAVMNGAPLTTRRFIQEFPARAAAISRPELTAQLISLYSKQLPTGQTWTDWMTAWERDYAAQTTDAPPEIHPLKKVYYQQAMDALRDELPAAALWILVKSWSNLATDGKNAAAMPGGWLNAAEILGLGPKDVDIRLGELDQYLDSIEEIVDLWGQSEGLWDEVSTL